MDHTPAPRRPRDWRTRAALSQPTAAPDRDAASSFDVRPRPALRTRPASATVEAAGVVTSESPAPWVRDAPGTRIVRMASWLAIGTALLTTGVGSVLLATLVGLLLVPLVLLVVIGLVARALGLGGSLLPTLLSFGLFRPRPRGRQGEPGSQLTVRRPDGSVEEWVLATSRRIPAGTPIRVWGPALAGRRSAWFLSVADGPIIATRGSLAATVVGVAGAFALVAVLVGLVP